MSTKGRELLDAFGHVRHDRSKELGVRRATHAFAVAMLGLFFLSILGAIALGTSVYRRIYDSSRSIEDARLSLGVIENTIRANDATGSVKLSDGPEGQALVLVEHLESGIYETRFYLANGWIMEEYAPAGEPLSVTSATPIAESETFVVELDEQSVTVSCDAGSTTMALRSNDATVTAVGEVDE